MTETNQVNIDELTTMLTPVDVMRLIEGSVPVIWDRFTELNGFFVVFGRLERPDGQRDFLLFEMQEGCPIGDVFYTTSSAKYSCLISVILYGADEDHNDCQPIAGLLGRYQRTTER